MNCTYRLIYGNCDVETGSEFLTMCENHASKVLGQHQAEFEREQMIISEIKENE